MTSIGPLVMEVSLRLYRCLLGSLEHVFFNLPLSLLHMCWVFLHLFFYFFLSFGFYSSLLFSTPQLTHRKCSRLLLSETNLAHTPHWAPSPNLASGINVSLVLSAVLKQMLPHGFMPANLCSPSIEQGTLTGHCTKTNTLLWGCRFSK